MEEKDRFISSTKNMSDVEVENKLRPVSFDEYVGQEKIKANLKVYITAAKKRKEALMLQLPRMKSSVLPILPIAISILLSFLASA